MGRRAAKYTKDEIARILKAAADTGARTIIEVTPDGTIRLVVNDAPMDDRRNKEIVL